ncbi:MAG: hypothetical protein ACOX8A_00870 [Thermacetogeniaceae bacterium]
MIGPISQPVPLIGPSDQSVFPCQRSDLRRLLLALDEGAVNDSQSETGMLS